VVKIRATAIEVEIIIAHLLPVHRLLAVQMASTPRLRACLADLILVPSVFLPSFVLLYSESQPAIPASIHFFSVFIVILSWATVVRVIDANKAYHISFRTAFAKLVAIATIHFAIVKITGFS